MKLIELRPFPLLVPATTVSSPPFKWNFAMGRALLLGTNTRQAFIGRDARAQELRPQDIIVKLHVMAYQVITKMEMVHELREDLPDRHALFVRLQRIESVIDPERFHRDDPA